MTKSSGKHNSYMEDRRGKHNSNIKDGRGNREKAKQK